MCVELIQTILLSLFDNEQLSKDSIMVNTSIIIMEDIFDTLETYCGDNIRDFNNHIVYNFISKFKKHAVLSEIAF